MLGIRQDRIRNEYNVITWAEFRLQLQTDDVETLNGLSMKIRNGK